MVTPVRGVRWLTLSASIWRQGLGMQILVSSIVRTMKTQTSPLVQMSTALDRGKSLTKSQRVFWLATRRYDLNQPPVPWLVVNSSWHPSFYQTWYPLQLPGKQRKGPSLASIQRSQYHPILNLQTSTYEKASNCRHPGWCCERNQPEPTPWCDTGTCPSSNANSIAPASSACSQWPFPCFGIGMSVLFMGCVYVFLIRV